jgi:formate dehydrogenase subunit gamma
MSESQSGRGHAPAAPIRAPLEEIIRPYQGRRGVLLEVFHKIQEAYGYVPQEAMSLVARALRMHAPTVYGTLTFYTEFRLKPAARASFEICLGPTCCLLGARVIHEILDYRLAGSDYEIREVECAGHCQFAPLLYLNGQVRPNVGVGDAAALAEEAQRV